MFKAFSDFTFLYVLHFPLQHCLTVVLQFFPFLSQVVTVDCDQGMSLSCSTTCCVLAASKISVCSSPVMVLAVTVFSTAKAIRAVAKSPVGEIIVAPCRLMVEFETQARFYTPPA